jgi:hypothetical protein
VSDPNEDTIAFTSSHPPFVTLSGYIYTIAPTASSSGTFTVTASLSDSINPIQNFPFNIIVAVNTPPTFASSPLVD